MEAIFPTPTNSAEQDQEMLRSVRRLVGFTAVVVTANTVFGLLTFQSVLSRTGIVASAVILFVLLAILAGISVRRNGARRLWIGYGALACLQLPLFFHPWTWNFFYSGRPWPEAFAFVFLVAAWLSTMTLVGVLLMPSVRAVYTRQSVDGMLRFILGVAAFFSLAGGSIAVFGMHKASRFVTLHHRQFHMTPYGNAMVEMISSPMRTRAEAIFGRQLPARPRPVFARENRSIKGALFLDTETWEGVFLAEGLLPGKDDDSGIRQIFNTVFENPKRLALSGGKTPSGLRLVPQSSLEVVTVAGPITAHRWKVGGGQGDAPYRLATARVITQGHTYFVSLMTIRNDSVVGLERFIRQLQTPIQVPLRSKTRASKATIAGQKP